MPLDPEAKNSIKITMDGPYEVSRDVPFNQEIIAADSGGVSQGWAKGREYDNPDPECSYNLCRCGHTKTAPYCDGTHNDVGFCGREHANREPYAEHAGIQEGEAVNLMDDESLCVGARFCDRGRTVWRLVDESGDPEKRKMAIEEACACPGGRLTIAEKDGSMIEPELPKEISAVQDPVNNFRGPLWVKGGIAIEGANGEKYETRNRVALCRCGESQNQPYCDGSHYNCRHMEGVDK